MLTCLKSSVSFENSIFKIFFNSSKISLMFPYTILKFSQSYYSVFSILTRQEVPNNWEQLNIGNIWWVITYHEFRKGRFSSGADIDKQMDPRTDPPV